MGSGIFLKPSSTPKEISAINTVGTSTMFYISIPLDGKIEKDRAPTFGMAMRGSRDYQVLNIDSKFVNNMVNRSTPMPSPAVGGMP